MADRGLGQNGRGREFGGAKDSLLSRDTGPGWAAVGAREERQARGEGSASTWELSRMVRCPSAWWRRAHGRTAALRQTVATLEAKKRHPPRPQIERPGDPMGALIGTDAACTGETLAWLRTRSRGTRNWRRACRITSLRIASTSAPDEQPWVGSAFCPSAPRLRSPLSAGERARPRLSSQRHAPAASVSRLKRAMSPGAGQVHNKIIESGGRPVAADISRASTRRTTVAVRLWATILISQSRNSNDPSTGQPSCVRDRDALSEPQRVAHAITSLLSTPSGAVTFIEMDTPAKVFVCYGPHAATLAASTPPRDWQVHMLNVSSHYGCFTNMLDNRHTELQQIQPRVDYSRTKEMGSYQVTSSPAKGLNEFQTRRPPQTTPSSQKIANVGARRSQRSAMLLQSPARPGHTTRMRQMFQGASMDTVHSRGRVNLYPQLPNVSRDCTPIMECQADKQSCTSKSASLLLPPNLPALSDLKKPAEVLKSQTPEISGAWLGDSSYLTTDSPVPRSSPYVSSRPHIDDWLSTISLHETPLRNNGRPASSIFQNNSPSNTHSKAIFASPSNLHDGKDTTRFCTADTLGLELHRPTQTGNQDYNGPFHRSRTSDALLKSPSSPQSRSHMSNRCRPSLSAQGSEPRNPSSPSKNQSPLNIDPCVELDVPEPATIKYSLPSNGVPIGLLTPVTSKPSHLRETHSPRERYDYANSELDLSPLSPNVCTRRGSSRYHSARRPRQATYFSDELDEEVLKYQSAKAPRRRGRRTTATHTPCRSQRTREKEASGVAEQR
ncbi:hypothetical protein P154DRAFT_592504 [Amniculicola lignicola CBS 123094]|uniref:Uncharacterized protein n=1 Tax=Amniculicola lignicola CBS 123094 TaxID=1392246 RepID=A0A6A5WZX6_9PLEO|nr:hypothetical protein P154DRAFT_592504 [Amniculicola lignicola CBS 123094]